MGDKPMQIDPQEAQDIINSLTLQRNEANDKCAMYLATIQKLKRRIAELEALEQEEEGEGDA